MYFIHVYMFLSLSTEGLISPGGGGGGVYIANKVPNIYDIIVGFQPVQLPPLVWDHHCQ